MGNKRNYCSLSSIFTRKKFIVNYTKYNNEEFIKPYINVMIFEFEYLFDLKNNSYHKIKNYAISLTNITSGCR